MRFSFIILCILSLNTYLYSQEEDINCIIFIDGKLPQGSYISNTYFSFSDSIGDIKKINFSYEIGNIHLTQENSQSLNLLKSEDEVTINFKEKKYNGEEYSYYGNLKVKWLYYRFLIIRITNLNKKKGDYYFGYSTPGESKKFIKKEYNMFEHYKE